MVRAPSQERGEAWEAVLRATQDLGMPCPRLQMTYIPFGPDEPSSMFNRECLYTLVLPLRAADIRREGDGGEQVRREWHALIGVTRQGGEKPPVAAGKVDPPFRDGVHAQRDAEVLGGMPIYAVYEGTATRVDREE